MTDHQMQQSRRGTVGGKSEFNVPSSLLKDHENKEVYELIGKRCVTLATAVVQVYMALPSSRDKWTKRYVGVATVTKDNLRKSYFIKVIDLASKKMVWEQELYSQFVYSAVQPYFHTFEADSCNAALNFASQQEAETFRYKIEEKLRAKEQRKIERKNQMTKKGPAPDRSASTLRPSNENQNRGPPPRSSSPSPPVNNQNNNAKKSVESKKNEKNKKKGKLTKHDIGLPSDFRHVGHVGWDPKGGFDVNNIDPKWKKLFDNAGITEKELQDEETSNFIYDFVESHGGIDLALESFNKPSAPLPSPPHDAGLPPPPPPSRNAPRAPTGRSGPLPPPPPPSRGTAPPPPPPSRSSGAPPPPPPSRVGGPPPPPGRSVPPPPAPQVGGSAPPPPPPPPVGGPVPPPPPAMSATPSPSAPSGGQARGALLDQIHHGAKLKKVDDEQRKSTSGDGRDALLDAIRKGKNLKTVSQEEHPPESPLPSTGLAGALMSALKEREKHIQDSGMHLCFGFSGYVIT
eukprot:gene3079-3544_t